MLKSRDYMIPLLRSAIEICLVLALAFVCAKVLWGFASPNGSSRQALTGTNLNVQIGSTESPQAGDYAILTRTNPFSAKKRDDGAIDDAALNAPETSLNLTLKGVRASGDGQGVAFILLPDNTQKRAEVGTEILNGVEVEYVFEDRVTLRTRGELETLYRRDPDIRALSRAENEQPDFKREHVSPQQRSFSARSFMQDVSFAIVRENGVRSGYRLGQRGTSDTLHEAGFEAGDIVREVNSYPVSEIGSEDLQELLLASSDIEFDVERDGKIVRILVQFT